MGFRAVVAVALAAMLALAWRELRARPGGGTIAAAASLLLLPAFLLAAADLYALYLLARGCATPMGGAWQAAGLTILALANAGLAASGLRSWSQGRRIGRLVRGLPPLEGPVLARLVEALPALAGVTVRVCPADHPVLFTTRAPEPVIVASSWVLAHLDDQERLAAFAHELGHIAHRDDRLLWWVHALCPADRGLFAAASRELSIGVEQRADAWAADHAADRLALASALVKVSRFSLEAPPPLPAFAGQASAVTARVQRLLDERKPVPAPAWAAWWPVLIVALGALLPLLHLVGRLCGAATL